MNPATWWILARATGLVAWGLLTLALVWGVLLRTRLVPRTLAPVWYDLHRWLAGLAVVFTAGHLAGLLLDGYIRFGPSDVFIPFAASWRPVPVALGVFALYLMLAIVLTSAAMHRLPRRWWAGIHRTSYAMFWLATAHAVTAGTDATAPVTLIALAAGSGAVLFGTVVRILAPDTPAGPGRPPVEPVAPRLTVRTVEPQGPDAVAVSLAVPPELRSAFRVRPGQHILLRRPGDAASGGRPYSVYAAEDGELRIAVRRVPDGRTSTWVTTELRPGDEVEVSLPRGSFGTTPDPSHRRHVLVLGAGSGVTPLLAIAAGVLGAEPESRVTFVLANRSRDRIMLRRQLDELVEGHPQRLRVVHVLSRGAQAPELAGPLDAALVQRLSDRLQLPEVDEAFLCGPGALVSEVRQALTALGLDPGRVHSELFGASIPSAGQHEAGSATVVIGGRAVAVATDRGETLLDAGLRAGLPLPYSCRAGHCGTCTAVLRPAGADPGTGDAVLACQTPCPADRVMLDFDQVLKS